MSLTMAALRTKNSMRSAAEQDRVTRVKVYTVSGVQIGLPKVGAGDDIGDDDDDDDDA